MDSSLYERLGGTDAISTVAVAFENRAAKDDRINQKFARTDLNRLTKEFVDQLCQDTGGPCRYTGRDTKETHTNMGVTSGSSLPLWRTWSRPWTTSTCPRLTRTSC
jgi:hemoglobin